MSSDVKAKEIALREIEKLRQFIESGEVTFVVAFGKKDGQDFHFGGTTGEHRSPEAIMRLAEVMSGLAVDLNRSVKQPRSSIIFVGDRRLAPGETIAEFKCARCGTVGAVENDGRHFCVALGGGSLSARND